MVARLLLLEMKHPVRIEVLTCLPEIGPVEAGKLTLRTHDGEQRLVQFPAGRSTIPYSVPTIAQATLWLAELGGYTGKSSGGPPGISRGLAKLRSAADAIAAFLAADDEKSG